MICDYLKIISELLGHSSKFGAQMNINRLPHTPQHTAKPTLRLAIGIATKARASALSEVVSALQHQTRHAAKIVVCATETSDVAGLDAHPQVQVLLSQPGLLRQRNVILAAVADCDLVLFLDDDFLMAPGYIAATLAIFEALPDIVASTGAIIADGTRGPGYDFKAAYALISLDRGYARTRGITTVAHAYGCNMALRLATVAREGLQFDERLPLYGWSEDIDFTHRLGQHGRIVEVQAARGVHLGMKLGRLPGLALGYSQVANPIYLCGKGSYSFARAIGSVGRNLVANTLKSLKPEPYIDRRGRLKGNALAFVDIACGRMAPERVLEI